MKPASPITRRHSLHVPAARMTPAVEGMRRRVTSRRSSGMSWMVVVVRLRSLDWIAVGMGGSDGTCTWFALGMGIKAGADVQ
jgi:hypothetical protein